MEIDKEGEDKSLHIVQRVYRFVQKPTGFQNETGTFQRAIDVILSYMASENTPGSFDDIVVSSLCQYHIFYMSKLYLVD